MVLREAVEGTAVGRIAYNVPVGAVRGELQYYLEVVNRDEKLLLNSSGIGQWTTQESWLEEGVVLLKSHHDMPHVVAWDGAVAVTYGGRAYAVKVYEKQHRLDAHALGSYHGELSDW